MGTGLVVVRNRAQSNGYLEKPADFLRSIRVLSHALHVFAVTVIIMVVCLLLIPIFTGLHQFIDSLGFQCLKAEGHKRTTT